MKILLSATFILATALAGCSTSYQKHPLTGR